MPTDRPRFGIYLDENTIEMWRHFCAVRGLTMSALGEGFGRCLDPTDQDPFLERVVLEARKVMAERLPAPRPE
jgi:hypothetical protein